MLINAANLLVDFAMVSDGPTPLGLRPQNENLHLKECSEWVQFPCFLHTHTQHQAGGIFRIIFHTSWCKKALTSGGGGARRTREGPRGGGIFHWEGGVLHHKGGWGRWVYGLCNDGP